MTGRPEQTSTPQAAAGRPAAAERSLLHSVAVPTEHGGWGLTLEPGLLGLLVAPSTAGLCLAVAAMVAFLVRTPLKVALVDRRRGRRLARTRLAAGVAAVELGVLGALAVAAVALAEPWFWVPALAALPLVLVEGWFEVRSRGRRLVPELCGSVGVCAVAPMIVLADGGDGHLAAGAWLILSSRVVTSIPWVRSQIARLHGRPANATVVRAGDAAALLGALVAVVIEPSLLIGAVAVVAVVVAQRTSGRRPVPRPAVIGIRQMAMGFGVVLAAAIGVIAS